MSPLETTAGTPPPRHPLPGAPFLDRIQASWNAPPRPGGAQWLLAEAERQAAPYATELASHGLHLRPATACGTLWHLHCTITGRPVGPVVTIGQIRRAIEG